jgi:hypothetical protein
MPNFALKARERLEAEEKPQRSATSAKGWRVSVIMRRAACKRSDSA